jgi:hypothetical protein
MRVIVATIEKENAGNVDNHQLLSSDDHSAFLKYEMSPLEVYSFLHWLDHSYSAVNTLSFDKRWVEEAALRDALETFLFNDGPVEASRSSERSISGFCQWHHLGKLHFEEIVSDLKPKISDDCRY